jgi:hypothetical protein
MGNQLTSRLHVDFMSELPKVGDGEGIVFGRVLGGGRFLKTLQVKILCSQTMCSAHSMLVVFSSIPQYVQRSLSSCHNLYSAGMKVRWL